MSIGPQKAPAYELYRTVAANDSLPMEDGKQSLNMSGYKTLNIQVIPSGGADPTVSVLFWSESAGKFVQGSTAISQAGIGANTPHEFSVDANGRRVFLAVSSLSAGSVDILVSGFGLQHPE